MAERKEIGIGMLGYGWMGKTHVNAFKTISYMHWDVSNYLPKLEMVGGRTEETGAKAAESLGFVRSCSGWDQIINDPGITVFDNVTPDHLHFQPTMDALEKGKHVICEKPLAVNREDAKEMLDAAERAGVKHLCCFNYRFFPAVRLAYELIHSGELGKIYHFSGNYYQDHGSSEDTHAEDIWYIKGSGVAQGITSHLIDMSRFLIGEIETVSGISKTYNRNRESRNGIIDVTADEGFFALMDFANDATGVIQSLGVANGKRSQFSFEIYGSKGSVMWDVQEPNYLYVYLSDTVNPKVTGFTKICVTEPNHPFMDIWWPKGHVLGWEHGHINMLAHFLDRVANDKPVSPLGATFEDGYKVAVIIDTINESSREGRKLDIRY